MEDYSVEAFAPNPKLEYLVFSTQRTPVLLKTDFIMVSIVILILLKRSVNRRTPARTLVVHEDYIVLQLVGYDSGRCNDTVNSQQP